MTQAKAAQVSKLAMANFHRAKKQNIFSLTLFFAYLETDRLYTLSKVVNLDQAQKLANNH